MTDAPLFSAVADGPEGGRAFWVQAVDGVRLRLGRWTHQGAQGTVLLLPGRTGSYLGVRALHRAACKPDVAFARPTPTLLYPHWGKSTIPAHQ